MENAMFERLELQSDDILQAYYMRSQSLLLLEYAGTLEKLWDFRTVQISRRQYLHRWRLQSHRQMAKSCSRQNIFWHLRKKRRSVAVFLQQDECRSRSRSA